MLTRANSISRLLYSRSNTETSSVTVWELKGPLTFKLELRMNENCMCADTCSPVIQPDQSCSLCSISIRLYMTVSLSWAVQNHPSQQWRTCCFTDDSHKTSRGDFHLLSAISFMFHGWAMEGSNPCFPFSPHSAEKRIRQRKRRITVTQVPLTPPSVQIYSITLESWTWEWNMTNKIMFPTSSRSDEQTFYCNSRKAETLPSPGSTAGIQS